MEILQTAGLAVSHRRLAARLAGEGMVLLQNEAEALPLKPGTRLVLLGAGSSDFAITGRGSGDVNVMHRPSLPAAFARGAKRGLFTVVDPGDGKREGLAGARTAALAHKADTAVYVITRLSGEGHDRRDIAGDFRLTAAETNDLDLLAADFAKLVVVLNVCGVIDTTWLKKHPQVAAVVAFLPGSGGAKALVDILTGRVNPSGRLPDTWAREPKDYPGSDTYFSHRGFVAYREGIKVGYRHFNASSAARAQVNYPFGFGLSYTTFAFTLGKPRRRGPDFSVGVDVLNTGRVKGKTAVELYVEPPLGKLPKPKAILVGFAKSRLLKPGAYQRLTIAIPAVYLASFDDKGVTGHRNAFVLEKGAYRFLAAPDAAAAGSDSAPGRELVLAKTRVLETLPELRLLSRTGDGMDPAVGLEGLDGVIRVNATALQAASGGATAIPLRDRLHYEGIDDRIFVAPAAKDQALNGRFEATHSGRYLFVLRGRSLLAQPTSVELVLDGKTSLALDVPVTTAGNGSLAAFGKAAVTALEAGPHAFAVKAGGNIQLSDVIARWQRPESTTPKVPDELRKFTGDELLGLLSGHDPVVAGASGTIGLAGAGKAELLDTADGPAGLRLPLECHTTAWPCAMLMAATFAPRCGVAFGRAVGQEARKLGVNTWLAPALNIHRSPFCGRDFEYFAEDPVLAGEMGASIVAGVQSRGVGATIKHFACNNKEENRNLSDSRVDLRALMEIYLKPFMIAVKKSRPAFLMTSYNILNGTETAENADLITGLLRHSWGYQGLVMTDWWNNSLEALELLAGNDVKMPRTDHSLARGLACGLLTPADLYPSALRVLKSLRAYAKP